MARIGSRDTAKDIMLGTAPSGLGPKLPKDTVRKPLPPKPIPPPIRPLPPLPPLPPPDPRPVMDPMVIARLSSAEKSNRSLMEELMKLQNEFRAFQGYHTNALGHEQEARKRLEGQLRSSSDVNARMSDRLKTAESGAGTLPYLKQDLDETKRARAQLEAELFRTQQDLAYLKGVVERQSNDLLSLNNEVKSRPIIDPSKLNNTQHLEAGVRDVHGQLMQIRQAVDSEVQDRRRIDQEHERNLQRLQAQMADQEARKNEILHALNAQENSKQSMTEEAKRLNAKIIFITEEVTRNMMANEQQLRDENTHNYLVLEKAIKAELEARLQYERDVKIYIDQRWIQYQEQMEHLHQQLAIEKEKNKQQAAIVNESLATLERHLEQGNRKVDRVLAAEIESRRLNEQALMSKLGELEDMLTGHVGHINGALDNVKRGMRVDPPPPIDTAALRSELDAIAHDKHKLGMEALLKLEERMNRIQQGMDRDNREMREKLDHLDRDHNDFKNDYNSQPHKPQEDPRKHIDEDSLARIRHQLQKLDDAQNEIGRAHDRLKQQVDHQKPKDVDELDVKMKQRQDELAQRIENEERERYIAVKDLQDEVARIKNRPVRSIEPDPRSVGPNPDIHQLANEKLQREIDECQVGIKKLAESVTTVKNVLDRKIDEESRVRIKEIDEVHKRIESLND